MNEIAAADTTVTKAEWGKMPDGTAVAIYTLKSGLIEVRVMGYGARIVSVKSADRDGQMADVVLGYDSLHEFLENDRGYLGAVVGRYGNRIAHGRFSIDGQSYQIPLNNGQNALHGGPVGFDKYVWRDQQVPGGVEFTLVSPDGDMGFPGTLTAKIRYTLAGGALRLDYSATTDKPTVVNLTNHAYFNLHGDDQGNILNQNMTLYADRYTPVNAELIPTGEEAPVDGTPLDFRSETMIGARIEDETEQLKRAGGYDHNFVLNGEEGQMKNAAKAHDPISGRTLSVATDQPGIQFYSGNFLDGSFTGRHGKKYNRRTGFCLETQHFPDSPNQPLFPSTLVRPGQEMRSTTIFTFGVEK